MRATVTSMASEVGLFQMGSFPEGGGRSLTRRAGVEWGGGRLGLREERSERQWVPAP